MGMCTDIRRSCYTKAEEHFVGDELKRWQEKIGNTRRSRLPLMELSIELDRATENLGVPTAVHVYKPNNN